MRQGAPSSTLADLRTRGDKNDGTPRLQRRAPPAASCAPSFGRFSGSVASAGVVGHRDKGYGLWRQGEVQGGHFSADRTFPSAVPNKGCTNYLITHARKYISTISKSQVMCNASTGLTGSARPTKVSQSSVDHDGACKQLGRPRWSLQAAQSTTMEPASSSAELGHPREEHEPRALAHVRLVLCRLGDA